MSGESRKRRWNVSVEGRYDELRRLWRTDPGSTTGGTAGNGPMCTLHGGHGT